MYPVYNAASAALALGITWTVGVLWHATPEPSRKLHHHRLVILLKTTIAVIRTLFNNRKFHILKKINVLNVGSPYKMKESLTFLMGSSLFLNIILLKVKPTILTN